MAMSFSVRDDASEELRKEYKATLNNMPINYLVKELLSYLDYIEETDSGREFKPICISSVRVLMTEPLNMCIQALRNKVK